jgi:hypothetical protein
MTLRVGLTDVFPFALSKQSVVVLLAGLIVPLDEASTRLLHADDSEVVVTTCLLLPALR